MSILRDHYNRAVTEHTDKTGRCDPKLIDRFAPLFTDQPASATLGEIAVKEAARGDPLALSFLAWKPAEQSSA